MTMNNAAREAANGDARLDAEKIARELGGAAKGTEGWWNAKCPAHNDHKASLGLRNTDNGGVAYRCMAGCDSRAVASALKARRLLPERPKARGKQRSRIVATYDYRDEKDTLLFQVVRFDPKDFRQRRPDPAAKDGWKGRLGDVRRVLYCLSELLAADPNEPVLVQGEKDVDRLRALGFVATTNPQGAGKWGKTDRAALAGRHVIVLPDNDEPGRKHAAEIRRDLTRPHPPVCCACQACLRKAM
jgi:hypothetical protein